MGELKVNHSKVATHSLQSGFTLVEFVISTALMVLVGFGVSWTLVSVNKGQAGLTQSNSEADYAREVVNFLKSNEQNKVNKAKKFISTKCTNVFSDIFKDPAFKNFLIDVDDPNKANLILDVSDRNFLGNKQIVRKGAIAYEYGEVVVSDLNLSNFILLDTYEGKKAVGNEPISVTDPNQIQKFLYYKANLTFKVTRGTGDGRVSKPIPLYFFIKPDGALASCSPAIDTTMGAMQQFCKSLGNDYILGMGDSVDGEQKLRCLVPVYNPKGQHYDTNRKLAVTNYIALQEMFCDFAGRGYSWLGRFCIGAN